MDLQIVPSLLEKRKDITGKDFLYFNFLTMAYLKEAPQTVQFAHDYLWETFKTTSFDNPNKDSTDFYLLMAETYGKECPDFILEWVKGVIKYHYNLENDNRFLLQLEQSLSIQNENLKNLRRKITEETIPYDDILEEAKKYDYEITPLLEDYKNIFDRITKLAVIMLHKNTILMKMIKKFSGRKLEEGLIDDTRNRARTLRQSNGVGGFIGNVGKMVAKDALKLAKNVKDTANRTNKVHEMASCASTSAGCIAQTTAPVGKKGKMPIMKRRKDTIFV